MPPKRKASTSGTTKSKKTKTTSPKVAKIGSMKQSNEKKFSANTCKRWFDQYADTDNHDTISSEGMAQLFENMNISLDSDLPLVLAYELKSEEMGVLTRNEWMKAMERLQIDNNASLSTHLSKTHTNLKSSTETLKPFYTFLFTYAKESDQKILDIEIAKAIWKLIFTPQTTYPLLNAFLEFLEVEKPIKVVNRDQWANLLDFLVSVKADLSGWDEFAAWPLLFDEFVEWKKNGGGDS